MKKGKKKSAKESQNVEMLPDRLNVADIRFTQDSISPSLSRHEKGQDPNILSIINSIKSNTLRDPLPPLNVFTICDDKEETMRYYSLSNRKLYILKKAGVETTAVIWQPFETIVDPKTITEEGDIDSGDFFKLTSRDYDGFFPVMKGSNHLRGEPDEDTPLGIFKQVVQDNVKFYLNGAEGRTLVDKKALYKNFKVFMEARFGYNLLERPILEIDFSDDDD